MDKINLHGSWELLLDEEQQGIKEHFYKSETPFPKQIQLPTTISEAKLTPRRDLASTDHLTDPYIGILEIPGYFFQFFIICNIVILQIPG